MNDDRRTRALTRPLVLDLEAFARLGGVHPDLVRRLVALGLLDPGRDATGRLLFPYTDLAELARLRRLRAAFALNYTALGLVADLLDRIADLESTARRPSAHRDPDRTRTT